LADDRNKGSFCIICGRAADESAPLLIPDSYFPEVWWHLTCLNSEEGRRWREIQQKQDAGYKRFIMLSSESLPIQCPKCGSEKNSLWPKFIGHSPNYEASCNRCHRVNHNALDPYANRKAVTKLLRHAENFSLGKHAENLDQIVRDLAEQYDPLIIQSQCLCGGRFSVGAKPRCRRCRTVIFDSYFHFVLPRTRPAGRRSVLPKTVGPPFQV